MELEHEGNRRARAVLRITADPPRFISAMQLGVTISSLAIGALGEQVLAHRLDTVMASFLAVILALLIVTYLHVVIGELVPKGIALGHPERTALAAVDAGALVLHRLPAADLGAPGIDRADPARARPRAARRRARGALRGRAAHAALELSAEQGEIEHEEQEMLYKVFDFADKEVSDVMVPRPEVVAISIALPAEEALKAVLESPYTRYPGLSRVARRHRRRPAHPRPDRGDARPRHRLRRRRVTRARRPTWSRRRRTSARS